LKDTHGSSRDRIVEKTSVSTPFHREGKCSCNQTVFREGLKEAEVCKPQKESLCQIPES
jgi:hypothetical protein